MEKSLMENNYWSHLPSELLLLIAKYTTIRNHVVLGAVCSHWGTTLRENKHHCNSTHHKQLPWLMLPIPKQGEEEPPCCGFYNLSEDQIYEIDIPEAHVHKCCGSCEGWLIMSGKSPSVFMLNPITRARIELPPITTFPYVLAYDPTNFDNEYLRLAFYRGIGDCEEHCSSEFMEYFGIHKAVLSGNPGLEDDYAVMAISSELSYLGYCKKGDDKWTSLKGLPLGPFYLGGNAQDIIYWKGLFYISYFKEVCTCDLSGPVPIFNTLLKVPSVPCLGSDLSYLVVISDELFMVARIYGWYTQEEFKDLVHCGGGCLPGNEEQYGVTHLDQFGNSDGSDEEAADYDDDTGSEDEEYTSSSEEEEEDISSSEEEEDDISHRRNGGEKKIREGTACFRVYKPDFEKQTWKRVHNIGDFFIFIGMNSSMAFQARDFPECKPNHIYFTKFQIPYGGNSWEQDLGAMDLETNKVHPFPGHHSRLTSFIRPTPLWISPSLF